MNKIYFNFSLNQFYLKTLKIETFSKYLFYKMSEIGSLTKDSNKSFKHIS